MVKAYSTPHLSETDIDDRVAARMDQQTLLDRENRPELFFIIDEAALHRWVGGSTVMRSQIKRLRELSERSRLTIQVIPFHIGAHGGIQGPFQILEMGAGEDYVLYLDDAAGGLASRDMEAETEQYLMLFWELERISTRPEEFTGFLDSVRLTLDRDTGE